MNLARLKNHRIIASLLAIIMVVLSFQMHPVRAYADTGDDGFIVTGSYDGNFDLSVNNRELFAKDDALPGDTWEAKIHVQNKGYKPMNFRVYEIINDLPNDPRLFHFLDLKLSDHKGNILYQGSYGGTEVPVMDFIEIAPKKAITLKAVVAFPRTADNSFMNAQMDSTWVFEANYPESNKHDEKLMNYTVYYVDEDGNELHEPKVSTGAVGTTYKEYAVDIEGYTPDKDMKKIKIVAVGENELYFYYTKDGEEIVPPVDPDDPNIPVDPDQPNQPDNPDKPGTPDEPGKPGDGPIKTGVDFLKNHVVSVTSVFIGAIAVIAAVLMYRKRRA